MDHIEPSSAPEPVGSRDRPSLRPTVDELSEASFPASDPPPSWIWEPERAAAPTP